MGALWKDASRFAKFVKVNVIKKIIHFSFFHQQAQNVILSHNASRPLFLYLPFQNVHKPLQAPQKYINKYQFINNTARRLHAAMADIVDEAIGNVTQAMKQAG